MLPSQQIVGQVQPAKHIQANSCETDSRNRVVIHPSDARVPRVPDLPRNGPQPLPNVLQTVRHRNARKIFDALISQLPRHPQPQRSPMQRGNLPTNQYRNPLTTSAKNPAVLIQCVTRTTAECRRSSIPPIISRSAACCRYPLTPSVSRSIDSEVPCLQMQAQERHRIDYRCELRIYQDHDDRAR